MLDIRQTRVTHKETGSHREVISISPLPNGYGMTLGNALRRVLLTSLPGYATTAFKIEGANHEFKTIKGIKESVLDIMLNLKQLRVEKFTREPVRLYLDTKKTGVVTAADIQENSDIRIVNPELYLFSLDKGHAKIEIIIESGVGYIPAMARDRKQYDAEMVLVDSLFSPIKKVRYDVEDTRVAQMTDLNKLNIEIETDGTISPYDALARSSRILKGYFELFDFLPPDEEEVAEEIAKEEESKQYTPVETLRLSPRTLNALINNNIGSIEQLIDYNEKRLMNLKGFGKKAMTEIKDSLKAVDKSIKED